MATQPEPRQEGDNPVRPAKTRLISAVEKMRSALSEFANDDNWFDAWDYAGKAKAWLPESAPDDLAREALPTEDISALVEQVIQENTDAAEGV